MMTLKLSALLFVSCLGAHGLLAQESGPPTGRGPGYYGNWPSPHGQQIVRDLSGVRIDDEAGYFGGGKWELQWGGVTLHPLGPGRSDALELRSVRTKGPHVMLSRGKCAFYLPTRSDADIAALLALLGRPVDAQLEPGSVSPEWQMAIGRIEGLGAEQYGLRVGVEPDVVGESVRVRVWNVSNRMRVLAGDVSLQVTRGPRLKKGDGPLLSGPAGPPKFDGLALPVSLRWPPQVESSDGRSYVRLEPGSVYESSIHVGALVVHGQSLEVAKPEQVPAAVVRDFWVRLRIGSIGGGIWSGPPDLMPVGSGSGPALFSAARKVKFGEVVAMAADKSSSGR